MLGYPCGHVHNDDVWNEIIRCKRSAVLWINERTGDYVVAWIFKQHYLFTHKYGNGSWRNWNSKRKYNGRNLGYLDLAYKNSKLYLYTTENHIKIIDFSRDFPKEEIEKNPYLDHPFHDDKILEYFIAEYIPLEKRIPIRKSGEVLIILSVLKVKDVAKYSFHVFKLNFESGEWERVYSFGDGEMLIFGHGVTIRAPVQDVCDGIKSDSICFVEDDLWSGNHIDSCCGVFDLATTSIIKWPKQSGFYITRLQWFVPGFA